MRALATLLLAACVPNPSHPTQGSTAPIGDAFYCSVTKQCYTAKADCGQGDCQRLDHAWCAIYTENGVDRFLCGVERDDCWELTERSRSRDISACTSRTALRP